MFIRSQDRNVLIKASSISYLMIDNCKIWAYSIYYKKIALLGEFITKEIAQEELDKLSLFINMTKIGDYEKAIYEISPKEEQQ